MDPELQAIVERMVSAGESEENIALVIQNYEPQSGALERGARGFMGRIGDALRALPDTAKQVVTDPVGTARGLYENQMKQFEKAGTAYGEGRYSEMLGHGAAGLLPGVGPAAAEIGENLGTGKAENVGSAVADIAMLSLPKTLPPVVRGADKAVRAAGNFVEAHPSVAALAGAGLGYATGGVPGALVGAGGGGVVGRLADISKVLRPKGKATSAVTHAGRPDLDAPNISNPRAGAALPDESLEGLESIVTRNDYVPPKPNTLPADMVMPGEEAGYNVARSGASELPENAARTWIDDATRERSNKPMNYGRYTDARRRLDDLKTDPQGSRMRNTENELLEGVESAPLAFLDRQHASFLERSNPSISGVESMYRPKVRIPVEGVDSDAAMRVLIREAESGRGRIGDQQLHRDLFNMDQRYRHLVGR